MAYVTPASSYEQALDFAQQEFADELGHIKRDRIMFSVLVDGGRAVRIGAIAWPAVVSRLKRYEIIDVHVKSVPERVDGPPDYDVTVVEEEANGTETKRTETTSNKATKEGLRHLLGLK